MVQPQQSVIIGQPPNFWLFNHRDGFDLTRPAQVSCPAQPRVVLKSTTSKITIAPHKTALMIIDMQNFFLATALGRQLGEGHKAEEVLLKYGIPAARKAGIQIIWLTWGVTSRGLQTMPPTVWRIFGWEIVDDGEEFDVVDDDYSIEDDRHVKRKERKSDGGLGSPLGQVTLDDGTVVDAGKMLMRDEWNTALHDPLEKAFQGSLKTNLPDQRFHKERLSGLWGPSNDLQSFLEAKGITTLLFTGVNTDQCVLATIQDANNKSFDTVLLADGCGTTAPEYAKQMVMYNCQKSWGFVSSCEELANGVTEAFPSFG